jgi:hypothetical protein
MGYDGMTCECLGRRPRDAGKRKPAGADAVTAVHIVGSGMLIRPVCAERKKM